VISLFTDPEWNFTLKFGSRKLAVPAVFITLEIYSLKLWAKEAVGYLEKLLNAQNKEHFGLWENWKKGLSSMHYFQNLFKK